MAQLSRHIILRYLELALICCIIGLHFHSENYGQAARFISSATAGGYLVILVGLLAKHFMGIPINRRLELFYISVGCIFFLISGALVIDEMEKIGINTSFRDRGLARGSLCIIEAILLLIDLYLTYKGED